MCFDADSSPPIPVSGGAARHRRLRLESADGTSFDAFEAFPDGPATTGVVVLPDVRGLFPFYEQLTERLAEQGHLAIAIDYFGRTAGTDERPDDFPFMDHVRLTTFPGVAGDTSAAVHHLRESRCERVFVLGFCFGGSNAWHMAAEGLGLAGVIGFYGHPDREFPIGSGTVMGKVETMTCPVLGLMGGGDPGIPVELVERFREALARAGIEHEIIVYPGAPHSFFDRKQSDFERESLDAWERVPRFMA